MLHFPCPHKVFTIVYYKNKNHIKVLGYTLERFVFHSFNVSFVILGINTPGKYTCKCNPDFYEKEPDGKTCKRLDNIDPWILFSNKYYIRNMSADARDMSLIQQELRNVVSLDYHYENQNLYFADVTAKTIFKAKIGQNDITNREPVIKHGAEGLEGIAVDWINNKLYWVDRYLI